MDLDPWDNVILDGKNAPGFCTVVTRGGGSFDVGMVFPFTRESWDEVQDWVDAIWTEKKVRPRVKAVTVEHPELALRAVRSVLVTSISTPIAAEPPLGMEHLAVEWKMIRLSLVEAS
jgi:hypothetical protein